jgi:hypothetical protein
MISTTAIALSAVGGLVLGPFIVRALAGMAPGGLRIRAAKWQIERGLSMGEQWVLEQTGDRDYELVHRGGIQLDGSKLGHIDTGGGATPFAVAYTEQAVDQSDLVIQQDEPPVAASRPDTEPLSDRMDATDTNGSEGASA